MDHPHQQPVTCILPSNAPILAEHAYHELSSTPSRVLQERCGNRRDEPPEEQRLKRAFDLLETTEANFLANVRRGRFKALEKKLPQVIHDAKKLWRHLWRCEEFRRYRGRQPKDSDCTAAPGDKSDKTWPDHMEVAFCRGMLVTS
jgi:hypothetical protein